jgi:RNA polymerase sigma factor (sigma-70 family)
MDDYHEDPQTLEQELAQADIKNNPKTNRARREKIKLKLVMNNLPRAVDYMRRICRGARSTGEMVSMSYQALVRAAENFRSQGKSFFHYSKAYLRGEVAREWERQQVVRNAGSAALIEFSEESLAEAHETTFFDELDFQSIETREEALSLKRCLRRLTPYERQVIRLHYIEGKTFQDIGTMMKVGRSAVQATHAKAVLKMRRFLIKKKRTARHEHTGT